VGALVHKKTRQRRVLVDVFSASFFYPFFSDSEPNNGRSNSEKSMVLYGRGEIFRDFGKFPKNKFLITFCFHFGRLLECSGELFGKN